MKYLVFVFLFAFSEATPGYSDSNYNENDIKHESTVNSAGGAYSYSGSTSGAFPGGFPTGGFPGFVPYFQPFDFSSFFEQLNRQHQEFLKQLQKLAEGHGHLGSATGPGSYASNYQGSYKGSAQTYGAAGGAGGGAAGGYGDGYGVGNRGGFVGGYGGGYSGPGGSYSFSGPVGDNAAFASGSIGPGGGQQTAAVYPENPNAPNVNTRIGASSGNGGGDFKSVFTSSKSVTSNINGQPQTFRQASTTINDNGKVTTYTAHNP